MPNIKRLQMLAYYAFILKNYIILENCKYNSVILHSMVLRLVYKIFNTNILISGKYSYNVTNK